MDFTSFCVRYHVGILSCFFLFIYKVLCSITIFLYHYYHIACIYWGINSTEFHTVHSFHLIPRQHSYTLLTRTVCVPLHYNIFVIVFLLYDVFWFIMSREKSDDMLVFSSSLLRVYLINNADDCINQLRIRSIECGICGRKGNCCFGEILINTFCTQTHRVREVWDAFLIVNICKTIESICNSIFY